MYRFFSKVKFLLLLQLHRACIIILPAACGFYYLTNYNVFKAKHLKHFEKNTL